MWKQKKYVSTYVTVTVISDSVERFLNMCRYKNIIFWNISSNEQGFTGNITRVDFLKLKDVCKKTKTKIRITKRHGIRFLFFQYRKHYSFLIGIAAACLILYLCGLYIWDVSFTGNYKYTDSSLRKYLNSLKIHSGMMIKEVDCDMIETSLRNEYSDITWVSAEISGTRLIVHIKENDGAKETEEVSGETRDIIAEKDGVISSIITRTGTPKVQKGDTVTAGQILVSGIVDVHNDAGEVVSQIYTRADADILIRMDITYEEHLDYEYEYKQYTGKKITKWILGVTDSDIEFGISFRKFSQADVITDVQVLKLTDSFYLPLRTGKKQYLEYEMRSQTYTEEEASNILNSKFNRYLLDLIENKVQILYNSVKIDNSGSDYKMSGIITADVPAFAYADITMTAIEGNEEME